MNRTEAETAILDRYPNIFPAAPKDGHRLSFGCGEGWFPVIDHLCGTVQSYLDNTSVPVPTLDGGSELLSPPQLVLTTVKEKLGMGRFYEHLQPFPAEVTAVVAEPVLAQARALFSAKFDGMILFAEHLTAVTCEKCGQPGHLMSRRSYLATRCPECAKREGFTPRAEEGSPDQIKSASVSPTMSLKSEQLEPLTKAAQSANLLVQDLRAAHKAACDDQPALEILLRKLLGEAAGLEQRLAELQSRCSE